VLNQGTKDCYIEDFNLSVTLFIGVAILIFGGRFCKKLAGDSGRRFGHNGYVRRVFRIGKRKNLLEGRYRLSGNKITASDSSVETKIQL